jgi:hypothetical protein
MTWKLESGRTRYQRVAQVEEGEMNPRCSMHDIRSPKDPAVCLSFAQHINNSRHMRMKDSEVNLDFGSREESFENS